MPRFDEWDLDYRPEKGDKTGTNILRAALEKRELSWYDRDRDRKVCRKALPRSSKEFAQLNPVLQSHFGGRLTKPRLGGSLPFFVPLKKLLLPKRLLFIFPVCGKICVKNNQMI